MNKLYLLPGLGDDHRIFKGIYTGDHKVINVTWIEAEKSDTLSSYAQKLIDAYDIAPGSVLIGNSLGGMLGIEIAKRISLSKVILISSIKTDNECSGRSTIKRYIPFYHQLRRLLASLASVVRGLPGRGGDKSNHELFISMMKNTSPAFFRWAQYAILHWDNQTVPQNVYHINGDEDAVFPYKNLKDPIIIKGGTHTMILDRKNDINNLLKEILS